LKKRYFQKRDKKLPKGFDSWLEVDLANGPLKESVHHPPKEYLIPYEIPHTYALDFIFTVGDTMYLAESKGRARDSAELRKYLFIRDALEDWRVFHHSEQRNIELFFIFENAKTPTPFAKKRKDGSKNSHGEWATKQGFRWLCKKRGDLDDVDSSESLIKKLDEMN